MDTNLNDLEAKVLEAVGLIKELRQENGRLTALAGDFEARVAELDRTNNQLQQELDEARQSTVNVEMYEAKRKEVEDRVGGLLQQLEALG